MNDDNNNNDNNDNNDNNNALVESKPVSSSASLATVVVNTRPSFMVEPTKRQSATNLLLSCIIWPSYYFPLSVFHTYMQASTMSSTPQKMYVYTIEQYQTSILVNALSPFLTVCLQHYCPASAKKFILDRLIVPPPSFTVESNTSISPNQPVLQLQYKDTVQILRHVCEVLGYNIVKVNSIVNHQDCQHCYQVYCDN